MRLRLHASTVPLAWKPAEDDPISVLADAVNQTLLLIEDIGFAASKGGFIKGTQERSHALRDRISELIPE